MTSKKGLIDLRSDCRNEQLHTIQARAPFHYGPFLIKWLKNIDKFLGTVKAKIFLKDPMNLESLKSPIFFATFLVQNDPLCILLLHTQLDERLKPH